MGIGYMLSPLSWWNDLFFNLPIAYGVGYLSSLFNPGSFLWATILGYWLSNVLGIVMVQWGATDWFFSDRPQNVKRDMLISLGSATAYTALIVALFGLHILDFPDFLAMP